jgi:hypothetical protein
MTLEDPDPDSAAAGTDIDLVTAALRVDTSELGTFVEALAVKLEEAVPGAVSVQRRRDGLFGPKLVRSLAVDAGEQRLELERDGPRVNTSASKLSGGIVLKREQLDTDSWLRALSQALAAQAAHSRTTRQALERLLNG